MNSIKIAKKVAQEYLQKQQLNSVSPYGAPAAPSYTLQPEVSLPQAEPASIVTQAAPYTPVNTLSPSSIGEMVMQVQRVPVTKRPSIFKRIAVNLLALVTSQMFVAGIFNYGIRFLGKMVFPGANWLPDDKFTDLDVESTAPESIVSVITFFVSLIVTKKAMNKVSFLNLDPKTEYKEVTKMVPANQVKSTFQQEAQKFKQNPGYYMRFVKPNGSLNKGALINEGVRILSK